MKDKLCPECSAVLTPYFGETEDRLTGRLCDDCGYEEDADGRLIEDSSYEEGRRNLTPDQLEKGKAYRVYDRNGIFLQGVYSGKNRGPMWFLADHFKWSIPAEEIGSIVEIDDVREWYG